MRGLAAMTWLLLAVIVSCIVAIVLAWPGQ